MLSDRPGSGAGGREHRQQLEQNVAVRQPTCLFGFPRATRIHPLEVVPLVVKDHEEFASRTRVNTSPPVDLCLDQRSIHSQDRVGPTVARPGAGIDVEVTRFQNRSGDEILDRQRLIARRLLAPDKPSTVSWSTRSRAPRTLTPVPSSTESGAGPGSSAEAWVDVLMVGAGTSRVNTSIHPCALADIREQLRR